MPSEWSHSEWSQSQLAAVLLLSLSAVGAEPCPGLAPRLQLMLARSVRNPTSSWGPLRVAVCENNLPDNCGSLAELTCDDASNETLEQITRMPQLRRLSLRCSSLEAVWIGPWARGLRALDVTACDVDDCFVLAVATAAPCLGELVLRDTYVELASSDVREAIAALPLTHLDLPDGAAAAVASVVPCLRSLRVLCFADDGEGFDVSGLAQLARLGIASAGPVTIEALPHLPALVDLTLRFPSGADGYLRLPSLRCLCVERCSVFPNFALPQLTRAVIDRCAVTGRQVAALAHVVSELILSRVQVLDPLPPIACPAVLHCRLSGTPLPPACVARLCGPRLLRLDLSHGTAAAVVEAVRGAPALESVVAVHMDWPLADVDALAAAQQSRLERNLAAVTVEADSGQVVDTPAVCGFQAARCDVTHRVM